MTTDKALNWALLLTGVEFIGDYGSKVQNPWLCFGAYNGLAAILLEAMKTESLIITNAYWDGISNIMTTILGFTFGERPSKTEWIGIVLISAGIWLLHYDHLAELLLSTTPLGPS